MAFASGFSASLLDSSSRPDTFQVAGVKHRNRRSDNGGCWCLLLPTSASFLDSSSRGTWASVFSASLLASASSCSRGTCCVCQQKPT